MILQGARARYRGEGPAECRVAWILEGHGRSLAQGRTEREPAPDASGDRQLLCVATFNGFALEPIRRTTVLLSRPALSHFVSPTRGVFQKWLTPPDAPSFGLANTGLQHRSFQLHCGHPDRGALERNGIQLVPRECLASVEDEAKSLKLRA